MKWIDSKDKLPAEGMIIVGYIECVHNVHVYRVLESGKERAYVRDNPTSSICDYRHKHPDMWFEVIMPSEEGEKEKEEIEDPIFTRAEILDL